MNLYDLWNQWLGALGENFFWYAGFAFPFFLCFWILGKKYVQKIRIQKKPRAKVHHFKHDLYFSAISLLVFATLDVGFLYLESMGYTQLYFAPDAHGWVWLVLSFPLVLFLDDTFFYWSHRAMHTRYLYRFFHRVHHESTDPSPLTAFAFHPSEAIVEQLMHLVLPFVMPLNFGVLIAWQVFSMLNNVLAHLGYEVYPKNWMNWPILKYKTVSTHHNMHHQLFRGNYALYFTWWDKWMGTEFKDYHQRHAQVFESEVEAQAEPSQADRTVSP